MRLKPLLLTSALILGLASVSLSTLAQTDCTNPAVPPEWFPHNNAPGQHKTPAPPFETFQGGSNCAFHQWSWQAFLWLTQTLEETNQPRFLSFMSPADLFGVGLSGEGVPRMGKSALPETLNEFMQAGTDGILTDQTGQPVYYTQYLNREFADFVTQNQLTNPDTLVAFDPATPFPIGALELKASWKIVQEGEDSSRFFTMQADVNLLANKDGQIVIDPTKVRNVTLALVGFHIGGRVNNHPEMIWATFEHIDNAPNVPPNLQPSDPVSNMDWTFFKAGTPYRNCNLNPANSPDLSLDETTQTLRPITQVCRLYQFGNNPDQPPDRKDRIQTNDQNIELLNNEVRARLTEEGDVWRHYMEVGAIWFQSDNALEPNDSLATDKLLTGSLKLSNATIETFTQTQSTMNNCFRCHNTEQRFPPTASLNPLPGKDVNISHIIVNGFFWTQKASAGDK